jgi:SAM-dependent methyltransferase
MLSENWKYTVDKLLSFRENEPRIRIEHFPFFTYAARWHWKLFKGNDSKLYKQIINPDNTVLKSYQDLLVFTIICDHLAQGKRILEVGGGNSRILKYFSDTHECWNCDKFEGLGNGPSVPGTSSKIRLVRDYIGTFNDELPDNHFDMVFSISALEHVPEQDSNYLQDILDDIDRVLKPGGMSLHLFDIVYKDGRVREFNKLIYHLFTSIDTVNPFVHPNVVAENYDIYFMSQKVYESRWMPVTKKSFSEFGSPTSINVLYIKPFPPLAK